MDTNLRLPANLFDDAHVSEEHPTLPSPACAVTSRNIIGSIGSGDMLATPEKLRNVVEPPRSEFDACGLASAVKKGSSSVTSSETTQSALSVNGSNADAMEYNVTDQTLSTPSSVSSPSLIRIDHSYAHILPDGDIPPVMPSALSSPQMFVQAPGQAPTAQPVASVRVTGMGRMRSVSQGSATGVNTSLLSDSSTGSGETFPVIPGLAVFYPNDSLMSDSDCSSLSDVDDLANIEPSLYLASSPPPPSANAFMNLTAPQMGRSLSVAPPTQLVEVHTSPPHRYPSGTAATSTPPLPVVRAVPVPDSMSPLPMATAPTSVVPVVRAVHVSGTICSTPTARIPGIKITGSGPDQMVNIVFSPPARTTTVNQNVVILPAPKPQQPRATDQLPEPADQENPPVVKELIEGVEFTIADVIKQSMNKSVASPEKKTAPVRSPLKKKSKAKSKSEKTSDFAADLEKMYADKFEVIEEDSVKSLKRKPPPLKTAISTTSVAAQPVKASPVPGAIKLSAKKKNHGKRGGTAAPKSNPIVEPSTSSSEEDESEAEDWGDYITRCVCGYSHNDDFMIECDKCEVWQHGLCVGVKRSKVPEKYLCELCNLRFIDKKKAKLLQQKKRRELELSESSGGSDNDDDDDDDEQDRSKPPHKLSGGKLATSLLSQAQEKYQEATKNVYSKGVSQMIAYRLKPTLADISLLDHLRVKLCDVLYVEALKPGLVATRTIPPEQPIVEYRGRLTTTDQYDGMESGQMHQFVLRYSGLAVPETIAVDARSYGTIARFVRRSCQPNAKVKHVLNAKNLHILIVAQELIERGSEISIGFDFNFDECVGPIECACNTEACELRTRNSDLKIEPSLNSKPQIEPPKSPIKRESAGRGRPPKHHDTAAKEDSTKLKLANVPKSKEAKKTVASEKLSAAKRHFQKVGKKSKKATSPVEKSTKSTPVVGKRRSMSQSSGMSSSAASPPVRPKRPAKSLIERMKEKMNIKSDTDEDYDDLPPLAKRVKADRSIKKEAPDDLLGSSSPVLATAQAQDVWAAAKINPKDARRSHEIKGLQDYWVKKEQEGVKCEDWTLPGERVKASREARKMQALMNQFAKIDTKSTVKRERSQDSSSFGGVEKADSPTKSKAGLVKSKSTKRKTVDQKTELEKSKDTATPKVSPRRLPSKGGLSGSDWTQWPSFVNREKPLRDSSRLLSPDHKSTGLTPAPIVSRLSNDSLDILVAAAAASSDSDSVGKSPAYSMRTPPSSEMSEGHTKKRWLRQVMSENEEQRETSAQNIVGGGPPAKKRLVHQPAGSNTPQPHEEPDSTTTDDSPSSVLVYTAQHHVQLNEPAALGDKLEALLSAAGAERSSTKTDLNTVESVVPSLTDFQMVQAESTTVAGESSSAMPLPDVNVDDSGTGESTVAPPLVRSQSTVDMLLKDAALFNHDDSNSGTDAEVASFFPNETGADPMGASALSTVTAMAIVDTEPVKKKVKVSLTEYRMRKPEPSELAGGTSVSEVVPSGGSASTSSFIPSIESLGSDKNIKLPTLKPQDLMTSLNLGKKAAAISSGAIGLTLKEPDNPSESFDQLKARIYGHNSSGTVSKSVGTSSHSMDINVAGSVTGDDSHTAMDSDDGVASLDVVAARYRADSQSSGEQISRMSLTDRLVSEFGLALDNSYQQGCLSDTSTDPAPEIDTVLDEPLEEGEVDTASAGPDAAMEFTPAIVSTAAMTSGDACTSSGTATPNSLNSFNAQLTQQMGQMLQMMGQFMGQFGSGGSAGPSSSSPLMPAMMAQMTPQLMADMRRLAAQQQQGRRAPGSGPSTGQSSPTATGGLDSRPKGEGPNWDAMSAAYGQDDDDDDVDVKGMEAEPMQAAQSFPPQSAGFRGNFRGRSGGPFPMGPRAAPWRGPSRGRGGQFRGSRPPWHR